MKSHKQRVCLSLDADLVESLRKYAENEDRSLSQYINRLLKGSKEAPKKRAVLIEDSPVK